jgi:hypothetical protein
MNLEKLALAVKVLLWVISWLCLIVGTGVFCKLVYRLFTLGWNFA